MPKRSELKPGTVFKYNWSLRQLCFVPPMANPPVGAWPSPDDQCCPDDDVEVVIVPLQSSVTSLPHYTTGGVSDVISPSHYANTIEAIDVIEAWDLNPRLANVVKYIARHGRKAGQDARGDLLKARAYLSREIARLEGRNGVWE